MGDKKKDGKKKKSSDHSAIDALLEKVDDVGTAIATPISNTAAAIGNAGDNTLDAVGNIVENASDRISSASGEAKRLVITTGEGVTGAAQAVIDKAHPDNKLGKKNKKKSEKKDNKKNKKK
ncbi:hypothetical protein [Leptolyngbya sp. FACHB-16]|uniref:hypothetical protein n=1 Tax=unclassified Leptolyngbya TaxID=2650499 RepID=UPI001689BB51|nr:hypothetical protein [Leptolyngbya sp. FACHB-16]MBD2152945.1 hypothetical protein [Leptolyngbya sp. FACHB-16]